MTLERTTGGATVEQQHVHAEAAEAHALTVDHTEKLRRLAFDSCFFEHLFDRHFGCRISDVGPSGGIQPHTRVGSAHKEYLAVVVAHDGSDRDFRRDVAGHTFSD